MIRKFIVLGLSLSLLISCVGCTMANKTAEDTGSNPGNTGITTSEAAEAETISDVSEVEDVNSIPETSSISSDNSSATSENTVSAPEIIDYTYQEYIYTTDTSRSFAICDDLCFTLPESVARSMRSISEMESRVTKVINASTLSGDVTLEKWKEAFQGLGYFAIYPDMAMLMSEDLIIQLGVFPEDENTAGLFSEFVTAEDGDLLAAAFDGVISGACYKSSGFSNVQPAGIVTEDDGSIFLSYIFAAEAVDFPITDSYYGYFITGYSPEEHSYFVLLFAGMSGITEPELMQELFNSVQKCEKNTEYWTKFALVED